MTTQQPEALDLADWLEAVGGGPSAKRCAALLREQHARIADLEAQLEAIGAGGVSGPLIGQPQAMPDLSQLTERGAKAWAGVDAQGLREGFTAADMATVSAQGFRDGAASVSAGSEPVATVFTMEALTPGGGVKYHATIHKALPAGTKLYAHPSPPEGPAGWQPIATAPKDGDVLLYSSITQRKPIIDRWHDYCRVNHPQFTHWQPLPAAPSSAGETK